MILSASILALSLYAEPMSDTVRRYSEDYKALQRRYDIAHSETRNTRLERFLREWRDTSDKIAFDKLAADEKIDLILLRNDIRRELKRCELRRQRITEMARFAPFLPNLIAMEEQRQALNFADGQKAATDLDRTSRELQSKRRELIVLSPPSRQDRLIANRTAAAIGDVRQILKRWFSFYNGYDPQFSWWVRQPYSKLDKDLEEYAAFLREKITGIARTDRDTIVGDPVGAEALRSELEFEMIPYSPEELIEIANREFAWCDREMLKATRELGYGDDWKKALEHVKQLYLPPGRQPGLIRELAEEAEKYMDDHDLITVPALARETWRIQMMTPERQRINPFFTGGEMLSVSYPVDEMTQEQKLMSMRGNNIHFTRATVFHELIPGHHLQQFMNKRYLPHREAFHTAFVTEGWSLYWEMLLWDMGFQKTPENRIGALFWRMHRCARIIFSLSFHLGKMTAPEAVEFLVNRVGHERENAVGEVRRSVEDASYGPLYQCAYMLGALQFRALRKELVDSGKMKNREFHDAILQQHNMPVEMLRAHLTRQALQRDFRTAWRFYGDLK